MVEERYRLENIIEKNVTKKLIPKGISLFRCMGGLALIAFLIQVGTGIFLVFYYVPSAGEAADSVQYIRHALPYGWLIQKVHAVTPYFMIVPLFIHMIRILFKGLYKDPRELHWVSGASLLVLTLVICYTGTCLPADSLTHLGAGSVGGDGGMASNRNLFIVYVLHIACIPIMMSVLMGFHFLMIRRTGVSEPL